MSEIISETDFAMAVFPETKKESSSLQLESIELQRLPINLLSLFCGSSGN